MIGTAAGVLFLFNGKISGISGVLGGSLQGNASWRWALLTGLIVGGALISWLSPVSIGLTFDASYPVLIAAGLLVGYGTQLGTGCTSGHGICGVSRGVRRSVAATVTFMAVAMAVVFLARHCIGGVA